MRLRGKFGGSMLLMLTLLLTSCQGHLTSAHRPKLPVLSAVPLIAPCPGLTSEKCVTLLLDDYEELVLELKQACIAGGYELKECK